MSDKRLFVMKAVIEYEYAVMAESADDAEKDFKSAKQALDDFASPCDLMDLKAKLAASSYIAPDGYCNDDTVYGCESGKDISWDEAVATDKLQK